MALGSTQPLTEMSTRNLPAGGVKGGRRVRLTLPPFLRRLSRKCGEPRRLRHLWGPSRPVTGIALPLFFRISNITNVNLSQRMLTYVS
jgi:hypothetical protein